MSHLCSSALFTRDGPGKVVGMRVFEDFTRSRTRSPLLRQNFGLYCVYDLLGKPISPSVWKQQNIGSLPGSRSKLPASNKISENVALTEPLEDFSWGTCLILAGCAFEAYNGLQHGEDDQIPLKSVSLGGTEVTFVDPSFLVQKVAGILEVTVVGASGLKPSGWWPWPSKIDPYCRVTLCGAAERTPTIPNTLEPTWNHSMHFVLTDPGTQRLGVRILDEDVGSDRLLGATFIGLTDLQDCETRDARLPLSSGGSGEVILTLTFGSFKNETLLAQGMGSSWRGRPILGTPASALASSPWKALKAAVLPAEIAANTAFDPVAFIDNPSSDTQAWVFWNLSAHQLVVSFRGTESERLRDVITDLSLVPTPLDLETGGVEENFSPASAGGDQAWVHSGFLRAYLSIHTEILQILDTILAGEHDPWTIFVTGHSLGGALSVLGSWELARRRTWPAGCPRPKIVNYSYGSPRVGNRAFAEAFNSAVPDCWRVVNNNDAVAFVPRLMGYAHVGHSVTVTADGSYKKELNTVTARGEGAAVQDVAAAVVSALGAAALQAEKLEEDPALSSSEALESLLRDEVDALVNLLDGSAVAEHLVSHLLSYCRQMPFSTPQKY